jgi:imidazolonepropionase-like amidohydrolase
VQARVVDVRAGQLLTGHTVVIEGDRISAVGPSARVRVPAGAQVINGMGRYVIPGLWDSHIHLTYLGPCALPVLVANGVTSVRDGGGILTDMSAWRADVAAGRLLGPRIYGAGPNLESAEWLDRAFKLLAPDNLIWQLGPRIRIDNAESAAAAVSKIHEAGGTFIKFRNLPAGPFESTVAAAKRLGMPVAGHAPRGISLVDASRAGIKSIEHAETVMLALGSAAEAERRAAFETLARHGTLITPTLVTDVAGHLTSATVARAILADSSGTTNAARRYIAPKTLALWRLGLELKQKYDDAADWTPLYRREVQDMRLAHRAGVRLMAGTDAGSLVGLYPGSGLHDELDLLVRDVGLTPAEALRSATETPPMFFGRRLNDLGAVEAGKAADLVLLDSNPLVDVANTRRIREVVLRGRLLERSDLDAALATVAQDVQTGTGCAAGSR